MPNATFVYDTVKCPKCGHVGCEMFNASCPTVWHCPVCDERWNPDNLPKPRVGDIITVHQLKLGDVVTYETKKELEGSGLPFRANSTESIPAARPNMDMTVTQIDAGGITVRRPYVTVYMEHDANRDVGEPTWSSGVETIHFRFDTSMMFYLLRR